METTYCEKVALEKSCKDYKAKAEHLSAVANKYASKEYIDSLVDGLTNSYTILK